MIFQSFLCLSLVITKAQPSPYCSYKDNFNLSVAYKNHNECVGEVGTTKKFKENFQWTRAVIKKNFNATLKKYSGEF